MIKIAIIISGEYRTFDECRHTMPFLDDLDNDIYITTWSKSIEKSPLLKINRTTDITVEKIEKDIGRNVIDIEIEDDFNWINEVPHQRKMIYRWYRGLELVKKSNINYDFILICRPDIFFNNKRFREKLNIDAEKWSKEVFYCDSCLDPHENVNLNDFILLASSNVMFNVITKELEQTLYKDCKNTSWNLNIHNWWYNQVIKKYPIQPLPAVLSEYILGRPRPNVLNWEIASTYYRVWLNTQIVEHIQQRGIETAENNWNRKLIDEALSEVNSRIFFE